MNLAAISIQWGFKLVHQFRKYWTVRTDLPEDYSFGYYPPVDGNLLG